MSNFMTLCEDSVVDFITRVEQPIQTMGSDIVDVSIWEFFVTFKISSLA